ncbi:flagellin [Heyndrickxia sporothermodurans]|uniref:flagellin N-terminal helical domain-containing protein n=1 Tax=Heyndrickxia sporothermodurans TaxID=46224 RepID=UPI002E1FBF34|nr:flagellin [Heyndrickxia sporothermodurans]MED3650583.1 flagellin [Heyndrickxia sporothermodurans]MED3653699.1 flagellin [Heyndrickxia sporothermodurans]MED3697347.1 flagellin [Heyndrickxia sporothermodurans]MED3780770.1 flagellin [Heyndrickxia sporothermodurans]
MRINHNIQALNAYRNLSQTMSSTSKSLEKLSSGLRINRAADDAAGLAISEKMRSQIRGLSMAERNSLDAVSLIQTAEGALNETHSILQRMRELSVQASNGTLEDNDRGAIQAEMNQLTFEIDRIADTTQFNQKKLFSGAEKGRPFAEISSDQVTYQGTGTWKGTITADPTDPAQVVMDFSAAFGKQLSTAIDGKTFTVNGKTYEIDITNGKTPGLSKSSNIAVNLTTAQWKDNAANDTDAVSNINNLLGALTSAINANDPTFTAKATNAENTGTTTDNIINNGKITLTTKANMAPIDAATIKVSTTFANTAVKYLDPTNLTTEVKNVIGKPNAINAETFNLKFSEVPKAGDQLKIGNLTINFGTTSKAYANKSATIDITGKDVFTVLNEINQTLVTAQKDTTNNPLKDLAPTFSVVGNTLSLGTTKTNDGTSGLAIQLIDKDFEANAGKDLEIQFQIGANSSETLTMSIGIMDAASLGLARDLQGNKITTPGLNAQAGVDVSTAQGASEAIDLIDQAIQKVSAERSKLGAYQNRLEHTVTNLQTANENLTAAESRIRDLDMAEEMTNYTRNNILNQAGQAMLAQANQLPQGILQLLK